jgi:hypothetical protein
LPIVQLAEDESVASAPARSIDRAICSCQARNDDFVFAIHGIVG